jgi:hypothetical protein
VARAKSWTAHSLSYAGRLQLIKSILFAVQTFWSSLFILPKAVIKRLEQVLRAFLWKGSELSHGGAKVAWVNVCLPFKEGGLGVKRLDTWNQAAMLKHVWNLCSDRENSIWSSWVWTYLIKRRSFWELKCPGDCSWTWRKILNLRELARGKIKYQVGDGRTSRDRIVWAESPNGKFSIKSAWNSVRHRETVVGWKRKLLTICSPLAHLRLVFGHSCAIGVRSHVHIGDGRQMWNGYLETSVINHCCP